MANNFLQFCVELPIKSEKIEDVKTLLDAMEFVNEGVLDDEEKEKWVGVPKILGDKLFTSVVDFGYIGFDYTFDEENLYISADEYGNVENAAYTIHRMVEEGMVDFTQVPNPYVLLTWSESCDKCRPDNFAGGAVMISHYGVDWQDNPHNWAVKRFEELQRFACNT